MDTWLKASYMSQITVPRTDDDPADALIFAALQSKSTILPPFGPYTIVAEPPAVQIAYSVAGMLPVYHVKKMHAVAPDGGRIS